MQKALVVDPNDCRTVHHLNELLSSGWIVKFASEQRVSSGGQGIASYGKIVYILDPKE